MSRGLAWLLGGLVLLPFLLWQVSRTPYSEPLPVLYTLGGDFTLASTRGGVLSLSDLKGELVLLNFGYTGCPDVCPTALARIRDSLQLLGSDRDRVQPLFVTLDPQADTLDRVGPYVEFFDDSFIGLTGSMAAVEAAATPYKVFYQRTESDSSAGYTISHSSHIYLIDAEGQVRATFGEGVPVAAIAASVRRLLSEPVMLASAGTARRDADSDVQKAGT